MAPQHFFGSFWSICKHLLNGQANIVGGGDGFVSKGLPLKSLFRRGKIVVWAPNVRDKMNKRRIFAAPSVPREIIYEIENLPEILAPQ